MIATAHFAPRWSTYRPRVTPGHGRRDKVWVFAVLEPQTELALTVRADGRATAHFLTLLDQIVHTWPTGNFILFLDNLTAHNPLDVRLRALAYPRVRFFFQPAYALWLKLIELWWKTLRSLALKERRFDDKAELIALLVRQGLPESSTQTLQLAQSRASIYFPDGAPNKYAR